MKELAYLQPGSVQTSVLLVCGLLMRRKSYWSVQIYASAKKVPEIA